MQYAVLLYFDEESEKDIDNNIQKIDVENYDMGMPPHITIFSWHCESAKDYIRDIEAFAKTQPKVAITFSSFGIFDTIGKYFFLSPVRGDALTKIHKSLSESIKLKEGDTYEKLYVDDNKWVPHCSIGYRLTEKNLPKFLTEALKNFDLPFSVTGSRLAICTLEPVNEIVTFKLEG